MNFLKKIFRRKGTDLRREYLDPNAPRAESDEKSREREERSAEPEQARPAAADLRREYLEPKPPPAAAPPPREKRVSNEPTRAPEEETVASIPLPRRPEKPTAPHDVQPDLFEAAARKPPDREPKPETERRFLHLKLEDGPERAAGPVRLEPGRLSVIGPAAALELGLFERFDSAPVLEPADVRKMSARRRKKAARPAPEHTPPPTVAAPVKVRAALDPLASIARSVGAEEVRGLAPERSDVALGELTADDEAIADYIALHGRVDEDALRREFKLEPPELSASLSRLVHHGMLLRGEKRLEPAPDLTPEGGAAILNSYLEPLLARLNDEDARDRWSRVAQLVAQGWKGRWHRTKAALQWKRGRKTRLALSFGKTQVRLSLKNVPEEKAEPLKTWAPTDKPKAKNNSKGAPVFECVLRAEFEPKTLAKILTQILGPA